MVVMAEIPHRNQETVNYWAGMKTFRPLSESVFLIRIFSLHIYSVALVSV